MDLDEMERVLVSGEVEGGGGGGYQWSGLKRVISGAGPWHLVTCGGSGAGEHWGREKSW